MLANFPAPIHATPRISLHECRTPKREALPGARQPRPPGSEGQRNERGKLGTVRWKMGDIAITFIDLEPKNKMVIVDERNRPGQI